MTSTVRTARASWRRSTTSSCGRREVRWRQPVPLGYQRVYGSKDRPINILAEVRSGDVVLVPHGWHGPAMAPPGYDMYYLNVMAGPGPEREWLVSEDPDHAWVAQTWAGQKVDPRLPFGARR